MPDDTAKRIKQAKDALDAANGRMSELKGRRSALLEQLRTEYGIEDLKEGDATLERMEAELKDKQGQLQDALDEMGELVEQLGEQGK